MNKIHSFSARLLAAAALAIAVTGALHAQTDYSGRKATSRLSIGVGASIGVAIPIGSLDSANDVIGSEAGLSGEAAPGFAYRTGLNVTYPISRSVGVHLNAGLDSRGVGKKINGELDARTYRANYFFIEPGFNISAFRLSMNIGMPLGLTQPVPGGTNDQSVDVGKDTLRLLLEPRVGATLVLMDKEQGWLGMTLDMGVPLGALYADAYNGQEGDIPFTRPLSLHLGVTWQFAIPGTGGL